MKYLTPFLTFAFFLLPFALLADEGDTLIVQTISWDTPTLPGWNSPRSGVYAFPGDTMEFAQILMYYTLKCDPSQNPACGEWDYLTYSKIHEHTGELDSTLYTHPNYLVNNASPDSFLFMQDESWRYHTWLEYSNQTDPIHSSAVGPGGEQLIWHEDNIAPDGRIQHIYMAEELQAGGLQAGAITGLKYNFGLGAISFTKFQLRMKNTTSDTLIPYRFVDDGLETFRYDSFCEEDLPTHVVMSVASAMA